MDATPVGGHLLLGAIRQGDGPLFRAFFASGGDPAGFALPDPAAPNPSNIVEIRGVAGSTMLVGRDDATSPQIQLATGTISITPTADERSLFAGLNVVLGFRLEEPAETVAEWLAYHEHHHGLQGAVIFDRARVQPGRQADGTFADALEQALSERDLGGLLVVVVEPGIPLGRPGSPPQNHIWLAPDAPGKDRITEPPDDPWLSPLGEELVLELAKWWFLADARAVLLLDPTDLLGPRQPDAPTAFDLCTRARRGVIALVGRRSYPWRMRDEGTPRFGDHICALAEPEPGILRWGAAPGIVDLNNTWRQTRVSYAKPDPDRVAHFWRAMALRIKGAASAALVARTALAEQTELIALATKALAHKPVRMPEAKMKSAPGQRTCIVTTMKNEGPFILEWLAYHRAIGVDDILVYTNDCTDGTDTMLSLLQEKGLVQHRINPWKRDGAIRPQHAALQAAEDEPAVQQAGWIICIDVDEFINIKLGDGRLPTLYAAMEAACPGANMISLTWRLFGNDDVGEFADTFIISQFVRCAQELIRKPHQAWGFKTLFRNLDVYKKMGVHRPKGLSPSLRDQVVWLNGSGKPMPAKMLRNGWRSSVDTYGYDWVQLNHYAVRSAESFLVKRDRGRVNHTDRDQGLAYWFRMNHNAVEDRSILARRTLLQAEWDRLMADPDIRAAHAHSVACHRAKIAELRATPDYADFYSELTGARLRTLSRRLKHFGTAVFAAGPGVVPDEIALAPDLSADFFFTIKAPEIPAEDDEDT